MDEPGSRASGRTTTPTRPDHHQRRDQDLGGRQEADRIGDPRSEEVEQQRPEREADQEAPRMIVKTYVVLPVPDASSRVQSTW